MRSPLLRLSVPLFALALAAAAFGQESASITGTVSDSSGAAIADAEVTVRMPERGLDRATKTNGSGDYLLSGLPIGTVNIIVTAPGFQKHVANGVVLQVGQKVRNDVAMQVGGNHRSERRRGHGRPG